MLSNKKDRKIIEDALNGNEGALMKVIDRIQTQTIDAINEKRSEDSLPPLSGQKSEKKKTIIDEATSPQKEVPWVEAVNTAFSNVMNAVGERNEIFMQGTPIIQNAAKVRGNLKAGLISKELHDKAMRELRKQWDQLGPDMEFNDAITSIINPTINPFLMKRK